MLERFVVFVILAALERRATKASFVPPAQWRSIWTCVVRCRSNSVEFLLTCSP